MASAHLLVLVEHQSTPERWMALRVLEYLVAIWSEHHRTHPGERLPPVFPLVVYSGNRRWSAPRSLAELLQPLPETLLASYQRFLPDFGYALLDLGREEDATLVQRSSVGLTELVLKYAGRRSLLGVLRECLPVLRDVYATKGWDSLQPIWVYMLEVEDELELEDMHAFVEEALGPEGGERARTLGQRLRREGYLQAQQEIAAAEQRAREAQQEQTRLREEQTKLQGEYRATLQSNARHLCRHRFGGLPPAVEALITFAPVEKLREMMERGWTVDTIDDWVR